MTQRIPAEVFPPGEYLKDELDARGWSQAEFAEIIGRDAGAINRIISAKTQITPDMACLLEQALGIEAQYWLNLESTYQLGKSRLLTKTSNQVTRRAKLHECFPIKQIISRGWVESSDNLDILYHNILSFYKINDINDTPKLLHAPKKKHDTQKNPIQLAWLFRTLHLANSLQVPSFTQEKLEEALIKLKCILEAPEEIRLVSRILTDAGIRFLIVEPFKGSKIDGACYWINNGKSPVVALSLLHPTMDCFLFDLLHELMHVANGHGKNEEILDEDMYSNQELNEEEILVNKEAENWLIPIDVFDDFVARHYPIFSKNNILGFSRRVHVHPSIVAGRLHKKGFIKDWAVHAKLKVNVRKIVTDTSLCDGWGTFSQI